MHYLKINKNKTKVIYEPGSKKILGYHDYYEILNFFLFFFVLSTLNQEYLDKSLTIERRRTRGKRKRERTEQLK